MQIPFGFSDFLAGFVISWKLFLFPERFPDSLEGVVFSCKEYNFLKGMLISSGPGLILVKN
jgi:hypothetical protein